MFDTSMTGAVGFAMHEDRLAKAADNLRLSEAQHGRRAAGGGRAMARLLGTARKRDGMVVRTVAGLPVSIGSDTRPVRFSGLTRLVRTLGVD
jgi:hypothetical protein